MSVMDDRATQRVESYRDAAVETHTGAELTLLRCHLEVRRGVPFGIIVTDRRVLYLQSGWQRAAWVDGAVDEVRDVALTARSPWPLRLLGLALAAAFVGVIYLASTGQVTQIDLRILALLGAASIGCFMSARNRLVLTWFQGEKRHRVEQPATWDRIERDLMSGALHDAATLLSNRAARLVATDKARARAAQNAPV
jgi:hypothetical protein